MIRFHTNLGTLDIELDAQNAPISAANFLRYAEEGFFNGTIFHRVIPGFVVQGGGMTPDMTPKPTHDPIQNEADNGLKNLRGTLSMARTSDPHSASSQFFINLVDNDFLDHRGKNPQGWGYAVFGKVTAGMETVDAMANIKTTRKGMHSDVPSQDIVIESTEIL